MTTIQQSNKPIQRDLYSFAITIVMILPIFLKGMLENEEYRIVLALIVVTAMGVIYDKFKAKDFTIHYSLSKIALIILCFAYLFSTRGAVDSLNAMYEWLKYIMLLGLVIVLNNTHSSQKKQLTMLKSLYFAGVIVALVGIDTISTGKVIGLINWFMRFLGFGYTSIQGTLNDFRMSSIFEYCNVYGTYTMICFLVGAIIILNEKKLITRLLISSLQFIQLYLFSLTLSRGAYLVWGLVIVILFLTSGRYMLKLIMASLPAFLSMIVLLAITLGQYNTHQFPIAGIWKYIIVLFFVSIVASLILYFIENKLHKTQAKPMSKVLRVLIIVGSIVVIGGIILVVTQKTIASRLDTVFVDDNSQYRAYYYDTAFRIFKAYPLFGTGGGGFPILNQAYMVKAHDEATYTHSYLFQVLVESGFIGLCGLLLLVFAQVRAVFTTIKRRLESNENYFRYVMAIISAGLLLHSMMEYTFSYGYLFIIYIAMLTFSDTTKTRSLVRSGCPKT